MTETINFFAKKLIDWYLQNKRELPWRSTQDPYKIWLSEIILQQTRVAQGTPYYFKFIETFPTVAHLANAPQDQVLKLWQGLGYYSRARNLHDTAIFIHKELDGVFPKTYKELLYLKGVGDYTASAIGSICYNLPTAVVDGNVYRVLSRVFGVDTPINTSQGSKAFKALAQKLIDTSQAGTYNQAVMEFGARYCTPKNPDCLQCIFAAQCDAYNTGRVAQLPLKLKSLKVKKRYFNYIVLLSTSGKTLLKKRTQKGIWQQLYEFPLVESTKEISQIELHKTEAFIKISETFSIENLSLFNEQSIIHKLSHQHLYTRFWIAHTKSNITKGVAIELVDTFAVPVLIGNFISSFEAFN